MIKLGSYLDQKARIMPLDNEIGIQSYCKILIRHFGDILYPEWVMGFFEMESLTKNNLGYRTQIRVGTNYLNNYIVE